MNLKIALLSYEYPPDTLLGGIGTYTYQVAKMLVHLDQYVEVFCGSPTRSDLYTESGVLVNRVFCPNGHSDFMENVLSVFEQRHAMVSFQVMESPEFKADGLLVAQKFPELPLTVKLHTPSYLIRKLTSNYAPLPNRLYIWLRQQLATHTHRQTDSQELAIIRRAQLVVSPSKSLGEIVGKHWDVPNIQQLHYPFNPPQQLLNLQLRDSATIKIAFVGRLEIRKGILPLIESIPDVLDSNPTVQFHFLGDDSVSPIPRVSMKSYVNWSLKKYKSQLIFHGHLTQEALYRELENIDICIFPSLWENFPNVCLEAMSAGKAVVASQNGGMSEMILDNETGFLVSPTDTESLSNKLNLLIANRELRLRLGRNARNAILRNFNFRNIGKQQLSLYQRTIENIGS